jgi:hypothetical protein
MIHDWSNFHLNELRDDDYGIKWPIGASQLTKELICFKKSLSHPGYKKIKSPFIHALRIIRRLWPNEILLFIDTKWGRIYNTYFLDVLKACCTFKHVGFTGPASSAKTYTVSVFNLIMFYSSPEDTLGMISTTSGAASERRIWADIKSLHRSAKWEENGIEPIGEIIEYMKCLTFDFDKTVDSTEYNKRDLRNAIQVIPIANDSKGEEALNTIMGSKNRRVLWTIDELPAMNDGVDRPCSNLEVNPFFQSLFIGNAQYKSDPHGMACEPMDGWDTIIGNRSQKWKSKTGRMIYFLHGECGPNDDERINKEEIKTKLDMPFPFLANFIARDNVAEDKGRGDKTLGKQTIDYIRFCIGYWAGDDATNTILTVAYVKAHKADLPPDPWASFERRTFSALDPAFTTGGDANSLTMIEYGTTIYGEPQIVFQSNSIEIRPIASDRVEYNKSVAIEVVKEVSPSHLDKDYGVKGDTSKIQVRPGDFGIDISNDAGKMLQSIQDVWGMRGQVAISSNEKSTDQRYDDRVTQLWWSVPDLIGSGKCRGFNTNSNYFKDLSSRRYSALSSDVVKVEKKKDMKKRIRRSPDHGDSFAYCCFLVLNAGLVKTYSQILKESTKTEKTEPSFIDDSVFSRMKKYSHSDDVNEFYHGDIDKYADDLI